MRINVRNHRDIATAYGTDAVEQVMDVLHERLRTLFSGSRNAKVGISRRITWFELVHDAHGVLARAEDGAAHRLADLSLQMLALPVRLDQKAFKSLGQNSGESFVEPVVSAKGVLVGACAVTGKQEADCIQMRQAGDIVADLAIATQAFEALATRRMQLAQQPVARDDTVVLYRECLARFWSGPPAAALCMTERSSRRRPEMPLADRARNGDAVPLAPATVIPALERLILTKEFDHAVLRQTVQMLETDLQAHLGCNVSRASFTHDGWWGALLERLAAVPQIASRLVIEITETAPFPDPAAAQALAARLRATGCRIALDDFGAGCTTASDLLLLKPDIVKVDGMIIAAAANGTLDIAALQGFVRLLAQFTQEIVLEGIETKRHLQVARAIGPCWLQGFSITGPAAVRTAHRTREAGTRQMNEYETIDTRQTAAVRLRS